MYSSATTDGLDTTMWWMTPDAPSADVQIAFLTPPTYAREFVADGEEPQHQTAAASSEMSGGAIAHHNYMSRSDLRRARHRILDADRLSRQNAAVDRLRRLMRSIDGVSDSNTDRATTMQ